MTKPTSNLDLDAALNDRIHRIAEVRRQTPDAIIRQAIRQYLEKEEKSEASPPDQHPSGKAWPRRSPVGGIITPL